MTLKIRLKKLESMGPDKWEPDAITIRVRDFRKGGKGLIPAEKFQLRTDSRKMLITRWPNETEAAFVIRATKIRDARIVRPRDRHDVPPTPVMIQIVDRKPSGCTALQRFKANS
jgi:hypothetical protein